MIMCRLICYTQKVDVDLGAVQVRNGKVPLCKKVVYEMDAEKYMPVCGAYMPYEPCLLIWLVSCQHHNSLYMLDA